MVEKTLLVLEEVIMRRIIWLAFFLWVSIRLWITKNKNLFIEIKKEVEERFKITPPPITIKEDRVRGGIYITPTIKPQQTNFLPSILEENRVKLFNLLNKYGIICNKGGTITYLGRIISLSDFPFCDCIKTVKDKNMEERVIHLINLMRDSWKLSLLKFENVSFKEDDLSHEFIDILTNVSKNEVSLENDSKKEQILNLTEGSYKEEDKKAASGVYTLGV